MIAKISGYGALVAHCKLLVYQALTSASRPRNHETGVPREPAPHCQQAPRPAQPVLALRRAKEYGKQ